MIVHKSGSYETGAHITQNLYPDSYYIDEETPDGSILATKIKRLYPYYVLVVNDGLLIDVIQRDKTTEEISEENAPAPKTVEQLRIEELEDQNAVLLSRLGDVEIALIELFGGGV